MLKPFSFVTFVVCLSQISFSLTRDHPLAFFPMEKELADIIDHDIDEEKINDLSNESALPKCEVRMCIVTD